MANCQYPDRERHRGTTLALHNKEQGILLHPSSLLYSGISSGLTKSMR